MKDGLITGERLAPRLKQVQWEPMPNKCAYCGWRYVALEWFLALSVAVNGILLTWGR